jgi:hypothetical protein
MPKGMLSDKTSDPSMLSTAFHMAPLLEEKILRDSKI